MEVIMTNEEVQTKVDAYEKKVALLESSNTELSGDIKTIRDTVFQFIDYLKIDLSLFEGDNFDKLNWIKKSQTIGDITGRAIKLFSNLKKSKRETDDDDEDEKPEDALNIKVDFERLKALGVKYK